jgi:hypothetical protein
LFFCPGGKHSPYRYYQQPEMGWRKYYRGPISLVDMPIEHLDFFKEPHIDHFAALLTEEMALAKANLPSDRVLPEAIEGRILDGEAYRANIVGDAPATLAPSTLLEIPVQITNTSEYSWPAYKNSGIALACRWRRRNNGKVKVWKDGFSALTTDLSPGQSCWTTLFIKTPDRTGDWILEIDLTDQGVCWFQDKGTQALKLPIRVSKLALIWQSLRRITTNGHAKEG